MLVETELKSEITDFPHAEWVSREYGVPIDNLIKIFRLEEQFHERILATSSAEDRKAQYHELYEEVHRLKQRDAAGEESQADSFTRLVLTFRRELEARSVLDVGCGNGSFLTRLAQLLPHGDLWGLDTSSIHTAENERPFRFIQKDVIDFTVERQFDVVFSHQVLEHIAPADVAAHLKSIRSALIDGGKLIVALPNKYWGPQDITRIVDNTFTGRLAAMGSHLNESSYVELEPTLKSLGFTKIRTTLPLGQFLPLLRNVRVSPWINQTLETSASLRRLNNMIRAGGKPVFKNPIVLTCEKA